MTAGRDLTAADVEYALSQTRLSGYIAARLNRIARGEPDRTEGDAVPLNEHGEVPLSYVFRNRDRADRAGDDEPPITLAPGPAVAGGDPRVNMQAFGGGATAGQDEPSFAEQFASIERDRVAGRSFGQAVTDHAGEEWLPFLVRSAAGDAVRAVVQRWRDAGRPDDVETLRELFPRAAAPAVDTAPVIRCGRCDHAQDDHEFYRDSPHDPCQVGDCPCEEFQYPDDDTAAPLAAVADLAREAIREREVVNRPGTTASGDEIWEAAGAAALAESILAALGTATAAPDPLRDAGDELTARVKAEHVADPKNWCMSCGADWPCESVRLAQRWEATRAGQDTDAPDPAASERDRIVRLSRDVARHMHENDVPEDVLRGWHAFAGWVRFGCRIEPDVRGPAGGDDA